MLCAWPPFSFNSWALLLGWSLEDATQRTEHARPSLCVTTKASLTGSRPRSNSTRRFLWGVRWETRTNTSQKRLPPSQTDMRGMTLLELQELAALAAFRRGRGELPHATYRARGPGAQAPSPDAFLKGLIEVAHKRRFKPWELRASHICSCVGCEADWPAEHIGPPGPAEKPCVPDVTTCLGPSTNCPACGARAGECRCALFSPDDWTRPQPPFQSLFKHPRSRKSFARWLNGVAKCFP